MNFTELCQYLSEELHVDFEPDREMAVSIEVDDLFTMQLEFDSVHQYIILVAYIQEIPPGKFRENVFFHALCSNHLATRVGSFGFYPEANQLTLHSIFSSLDLEKEKVLSTFEQIMDISHNWRDAIDSGKPSPENFSSSSSNPLKPFGLQP